MSSPTALKLLTRDEWHRLTVPERIEIVARRESARAPAAGPFTIDIDARPLAMLAEQAAVGHRVFEFMTIDAPGDIQRYSWVTLADVAPDIASRVRSSIRFRDPLKRDPGAVTHLPFDAFDRSYWKEETDWFGDDNGDLYALRWVWHRTSEFWPARLSSLLALTRDLQRRLRESRDALLRHEIALIDAGTHRRMFWAHREPIGGLDEGPSDQTHLPAGLLELMGALARRADIASISAPFRDYVFWRSMVLEQVRRATAAGRPPSEVLFLAGPDEGIRHVRAEDWGGSLHIPCEGACGADVFVLPDWHAFDADKAARAGTATAGFHDERRCTKILITDRDLGQFPADTRLSCEGWFVHQARTSRPYAW